MEALPASLFSLLEIPAHLGVQAGMDNGRIAKDRNQFPERLDGALESALKDFLC